MFTRKNLRLSGWIGLLLLGLILAACAGPAAPDTDATQTPEAGGVPETGSTGGEAVFDFDQLLEKLKGAGVNIAPAGQVQQEFFEPVGQVVKIEGADVQVFEFADEQSMQTAALQISPDGSAIGPVMVSWMDKPHFFAQGKLIALYVGSDEEVVQILTGIMGDPIAGMN